MTDTRAWGWQNPVTTGELFAHAPALVAIFRGPEHTLVTANRAVHEVLGTDESHTGRPLADLRPGAAPGLDPAVLDRVYRSGEYLTKSGVRLADATLPEERFYDIAYEPVRGATGRVTGVAAVAVEVTRLLRVERMTTGHQRLLEQIAQDVPLPQVLQDMARLMEEVLPGLRASILLLDEDGVRLRHAAAPTLPDFYVKAIDGLEIGPEVGTCGVAAHTRALAVTTDIGADPRWEGYHEIAAAAGLRGCWSTPILSGGQLLGTFAMYCPDTCAPRPEDLTLTSIVSRTAALAIERGRALAARRAADEREARARAELSMLAEITTVLTSTLDVHEALRRLARLTVPRLADWAAVILRTGEDEVDRVAIVPHRRIEDPPEGLLGPLPPIPERSSDPLVRALREGTASLLGPEQIAADPHSALQARQHELFEALRATSVIIVPLQARGQVLGTLTVARIDPARPYGPADLRLLEDIARRAGLAVDNAHLFDRQRTIAESMQHHLLSPMPVTEHLRMEARYRPAPGGSQVGGDWYDAFRLPDGVLALVIGDVMGHDLTAAAQMAELRSALRAIAWDRTGPPGEILGRLDPVMTGVCGARLATLLLARIEDGDPPVLCWSSAGHPPPLLVTHDGDTRFLEEGQGLLLGLGEYAAARPEGRRPMPPRSTLLLYTDGLVESPRVELDLGMGRLRRYAASLAHRPLREMCDALLRRLPEGHNDDTALLGVRAPPARRR